MAQLAGLVLAAGEVPLAAGYPRPAEFQAVRVMVAIQIACSTMIFPVLLHDWRMMMSACWFGWVMLTFAGALSAWPLGQVLPVGTYITLWLVALAGWRAALSQPRRLLLASAFGNTYVLGGVLVWYLRLEFGSGQLPTPGVQYGPLLIALADPRHPAAAGWWLIGGFAASGLLLAMYRRFRAGPTTDGVVIR